MKKITFINLVMAVTFIFSGLLTVQVANAGNCIAGGLPCPKGYWCHPSGNCVKKNSSGLNITGSITSDGIRITESEQFGGGFSVTSDPATGGNTLTGVPSSLDITYTITDDAGVTENVTYQCHVSK